MNLRVRYFAAFRDATGIDAEAVVTSASTPAELFVECTGRHAGLQKFTSSLVAINDEMAGWDSALNNDDEVLFFPPVAGG
jgi:molybdopterin converting factor small subunit